MSRTGVTFQQVELAAEKILATGESPTIEKVRRLLGGTGSNSTLSKHLHEWRSERLCASTSTLPAPNLPPDPVNAAVDRVWKEMAKESEAKIQTMRSHYETETSRIQQQLASIQEVNDSLTQERNALQQAYHQQTAEKELLSLDLKALQQQYQILQEQHTLLEQHYQILKQESTKHLAELRLSHQQTIEQYQAKHQLLENQTAQQIAELKTHYETLRQQAIVEIDSLKLGKKSQEKNNAQLLSELHALRIQLTESDANTNALKNYTEQIENSKTAQEKLHQINSTMYAELNAWQTAHVDEFKHIQTHLMGTDKTIYALIENLASISTKLDTTFLTVSQQSRNKKIRKIGNTCE